MKILAIADDDSLIGTTGCDSPELLITLGDLHDVAIVRAMERYRPRAAFGVRGNHDVEAPFPAGVTDLHLAVKTFDEVKFGGFAGSWKYKPRGHHLFEQDEVSRILRGFPAVDVFVAHNSPFGIHDRDADVHQGFHAFLDYIHRAKPRLFLHGHQHVDRVTVLGETTVVGVYGEREVKVG